MSRFHGSSVVSDAWLFYRDVLKAEDWIVQTVKEGHTFQFAEEVSTATVLKNNRSACKNQELVWAELLRLEQIPL